MDVLEQKNLTFFEKFYFKENATDRISVGWSFFLGLYDRGGLDRLHLNRRGKSGKSFFFIKIWQKMDGFVKSVVPHVEESDCWKTLENKKSRKTKTIKNRSIISSRDFFFKKTRRRHHSSVYKSLALQHEVFSEFLKKVIWRTVIRDIRRTHPACIP